MAISTILSANHGVNEPRSTLQICNLASAAGWAALRLHAPQRVNVPLAARPCSEPLRGGLNARTAPLPSGTARPGAPARRAPNALLCSVEGKQEFRAMLALAILTVTSMIVAGDMAKSRHRSARAWIWISSFVGPFGPLALSVLSTRNAPPS
jgi:hypothetical protein